MKFLSLIGRVSAFVAYRMNLPTSFALPAADVDALRDMARRWLCQSLPYRKLVEDLGGSAPD